MSPPLCPFHLSIPPPLECSASLSLCLYPSASLSLNFSNPPPFCPFASIPFSPSPSLPLTLSLSLPLSLPLPIHLSSLCQYSTPLCRFATISLCPTHLFIYSSCCIYLVSTLQPERWWRVGHPAPGQWWNECLWKIFYSYLVLTHILESRNGAAWPAVPGGGTEVHIVMWLYTEDTVHTNHTTLLHTPWEMWWLVALAGVAGVLHSISFWKKKLLVVSQLVRLV